MCWAMRFDWLQTSVRPTLIKLLLLPPDPVFREVLNASPFDTGSSKSNLETKIQVTWF